MLPFHEPLAIVGVRFPGKTGLGLDPESRLSHPGTVLAGRARSLIAALVDVLFTGQPFTVILPEASCTALFAAAWRRGVKVRLAPPDPMTGVAGPEAYAACAAEVQPPGLLLVTDAFGHRVDGAGLARQLAGQGWQVLQNDPCGLRLGEAPAAQTLGTICSFGPGKVVDAGGGGVFFTQHETLAQRLWDRVASYPPLNEQAHAVENYLVQLRRLLWYGHPSGRPLLELWQGFLQEEQAELRYRPPDGHHAVLAAAIANAGPCRQARAERAAAWLRHLAGGAGNGLILPTATPEAWWRCNVLVDRRRQEVIDRLVALGLPVGRLYPSLARSFPGLVPNGPSPACEAWSARVLNLPVANGIGEAEIGEGAATLLNVLQG